MLPFHNNDVATQSKSLLQSIEILAKEQCHYKPDSPVGLWNLGWFTSQVKHNEKQPWRAAVEFYNLMADCCVLADKADDDFYRAEAGVEAAMALVLGGKPIVGYSVKSGAKVLVCVCVLLLLNYYWSYRNIILLSPSILSLSLHYSLRFYATLT